ncbi:MAG: 50S ribosomal protein L21 [Bacteroidota bacterium]
MYAIVEIAGKQFRVEKDAKMYVPRLKDEVGDSVTFDRVLLVSGDDGVSVGTPTVEGASVTATVLDHVKGDKIIVFKKKRRKGYRVKNGHRQPYTQIQIGELSTN